MFMDCCELSATLADLGIAEDGRVESRESSSGVRSRIYTVGAKKKENMKSFVLCKIISQSELIFLWEYLLWLVSYVIHINWSNG